MSVRSCLRSIFCQPRAGSTPDPGGSLQPLDRQLRYYRLPHHSASSDAPTFGTGVTVQHSFRAGSSTLSLRSHARNATLSSGVSCPCAGHWPPSKLWAVVISTAPSTGSPGRSATSLVAALVGRLLFLRARRNSSSSRYITGTLLVAIRLPFVRVFIFRELRFDPR